MRRKKSTELQALYRFFKTCNIGGEVEKFFVEEIPLEKKFKRVGGKVFEGEETCFLLEKKGITTLDAIKLLSKVTGLPESKFGYAGLKDKNALTYQWISAKLSQKQIEILRREKFKGIRLKNFRKGQRIKIGDLKGNRFKIVVKNARKVELPKKVIFPNYFGPQRFGYENVEMGKKLLKHRKHVPKQILKLLSHAYQSYIFNKVLSECVRRRLKPEKIPLVGFKTKLGRDVVSKIVKNVLREERVSLSDFKNPGDVRKAFVETELKYKYNKRLFLEFELPPGSYATVLLMMLKIKK